MLLLLLKEACSDVVCVLCDCWHVKSAEHSYILIEVSLELHGPFPVCVVLTLELQYLERHGEVAGRARGDISNMQE